MSAAGGLCMDSRDGVIGVETDVGAGCVRTDATMDTSSRAGRPERISCGIGVRRGLFDVGRGGEGTRNLPNEGTALSGSAFGRPDGIRRSVTPDGFPHSGRRKRNRTVRLVGPRPEGRALRFDRGTVAVRRLAAGVGGTQGFTISAGVGTAGPRIRRRLVRGCSAATEALAAALPKCRRRPRIPGKSDPHFLDIGRRDAKLHPTG